MPSLLAWRVAMVLLISFAALLRAPKGSKSSSTTTLPVLVSQWRHSKLPSNAFCPDFAFRPSLHQLQFLKSLFANRHAALFAQQLLLDHQPFSRRS